jgi:hypothetical protein
MKNKRGILRVLFVLLIVSSLFSPFGTIAPPRSFAEDFKPTHELQVDLWVRKNVPNYSFRTGKWVLGEKIGLLRKGTPIQMIKKKIVGFTQLWMEVYYKLPDGSVQGGVGNWIWAGKKDSQENVRPLQAAAPGSGSLVPSLNSLIGMVWVSDAWAQGDSIPGEAGVYQGSAPGLEEPPIAEGDTIVNQLNSVRFIVWSYVGIYLFLLLGMILGIVWEMISTKPAGTSTQPIVPYYSKLFFRLLIGSLISFSIFIGPIMGIGSLGLTLSSAILSFHFGLVHSDPTDLILSLKRKYVVKS